MPRDGSGVYSADWTNAAPNTTIESSKQNAMVADLVADANAARPVTSGGTGETTARLKDGTWRFQNTADTTKLLAFDLSGLTTATTRTVTLPDASGTLVLVSDLRQPVTVASVATTSGSSVNIATGLPSWVSRITINFNAVSTNGTSRVKIQLGDSGGFVTTGYNAGSAQIAATTAIEEYTDGFGIRIFSAASASVYGSVTFTCQGTSAVWAAQGVLYDADGTGIMGIVSGLIVLSGALTQIRLTTTDTFDQGSVNAVYS